MSLRKSSKYQRNITNDFIGDPFPRQQWQSCLQAMYMNECNRTRKRVFAAIDRLAPGTARTSRIPAENAMKNVHDLLHYTKLNIREY